MNFLKVTPEPLNINDVSNLVAHDSCGAVSLFAGFTRDSFAEKKVLSLEYEAYEPMALKQMELISNSIRERWTDVKNIAIYHRLGLVPVHEISVIIAISSPHRKSSLEAVAFAIDDLKRIVPIWKKEQYEDNQSVWKENYECRWLKNDTKDKSSTRKECFKKLTDLDNSLYSHCEEENIPSNLVQIGANEDEIKRRIQCFIEKKRDEIDLNNIMDFTAVKRIPDINGDICESDSICARTNTVIIKQEGSAGHLRVHRVKNGIGPQMRPDYLQTLNKLMSVNTHESITVKREPFDPEDNKIEKNVLKLADSLNSRLYDIEEHLSIKTDNSRPVYERIKAIENRLLYLESISPEYKHFLRETFSAPRLSSTFALNTSVYTDRKIYSVDELDSIIKNMKQDASEQVKLPSKQSSEFERVVDSSEI